MDRDLILVKIESIQRCLKRLESKRPSSVEVLKDDIDSQDIVLLNLERLIQQSVDLALIILRDSAKVRPDSMAQSFKELGGLGILDKDLAERLSKAVGFRNIAVHEYQKLNWDIVWSILNERLGDFRNFIQVIMARLS